MSAILYVRVSSLEQEKEGYSLDAQEKLGIDYAKKNKLNIARTWKVVESAWSSKKVRLEFNQMIDYAKKHPEIKHIIFDITDRMTRNDFDKLKILELIKEHDKTIHFSRSNKILNKHATPEDIFMMDIEVAVAKKMSNDISRKSQMGMLEKAEQGVYPGSAPLGYLNNKETREIDVDETRAPFVKQLFELIASGKYSLGMASDYLYKEGLRSRKGNKVPKSAIAKMLRNPMYYGAFRYKDKIYHEAKHEPLISKCLFEKAQKILSGRNRPYKTRAGFTFNNLMRCGNCDCRVSGEMKKKRYTYYHCTFSKGRHGCAGYFREEKIVELFEEPIKKITIPNDLYLWMIDMLRETSQDTAKTNEKRLCELQKELGTAQDRLSRLIDVKLDNSIDNEMYNLKSEEYKNRIFEVKSQIQNVNRLNPNFFDDGCKTLELCKNLYSEYVRQDYTGKAEILKTVASNYTLHDLSITATYRKPFSILAKGLSRSKWLPRVDSNHGPNG